MSKRIKKKKNYNYPKANDEVDSSKNAEDKKIVKKKNNKKTEKFTDSKINDESNKETKEIDNDNKNQNNQTANKLNIANDNTNEIIKKENITSLQIENENIEDNLLNYYIEEIKKEIEEEKKDKFIISTELEEKNSDDLTNKPKKKSTA